MQLLLNFEWSPTSRRDRLVNLHRVNIRYCYRPHIEGPYANASDETVQFSRADLIDHHGEHHSVTLNVWITNESEYI